MAAMEEERKEREVVFCVAGRLFLPWDAIVILPPLPLLKSASMGTVEKSNAYLRATLLCLRPLRSSSTRDFVKIAKGL